MEIEILNCYLPKWPHLIIDGEDVTCEQAKDIIFKTDRWFTETMTEPHSNRPRAIHRDYRMISGLNEFTEILDNIYRNKVNILEYNLKLSNLSHSLKEHLNIVDNEFVRSDMADSHYIGGSHGICDIDGKIFYDRNIGKHPDAVEVYDEFKALVKEFPYLDFRAALYDIEKSERGEKPARQAVGFIVTNGDVIATNLNMNLDNKTDLDSLDTDIREMLSGNGICGIPNEWFYEFAERVKQGMEELDMYTQLNKIKRQIGMI